MASSPWRLDDAGPIPVEPVEGWRPETIVEADRSIWRYRASIQVADESIVSLGEGSTPLVPGPDGLFMKCEFVTPSGSFKDRGASVLVSGLCEAGVDAFFLDSSGNAGAAMAMYAAAAGMRCEVLVPDSTPEAKTRHAEAYGAQIVRIEGDREAAAEAARRRADGEAYASHNWQPLFIHGTKTMAYELWEQTGGRLPDHIVLPVGYGSLLMGCHLGFRELRLAGAIDAMPRLHAAQAAACAPLDAAWRADLGEVPAVDPEPTVALAIAASAPVRGRAMLDAVRESGGTTSAIAERDIDDHWRALGRAGFYVEPSCAVAYGAALELRRAGIIAFGDEAVVVLTGSGLKS